LALSALCPACSPWSDPLLCVFARAVAGATLHPRRGGETADAGDLKSPGPQPVWVRLPPPAPFPSQPLTTQEEALHSGAGVEQGTFSPLRELCAVSSPTFRTICLTTTCDSGGSLAGERGARTPDERSPERPRVFPSSGHWCSLRPATYDSTLTAAPASPEASGDNLGTESAQDDPADAKLTFRISSFMKSGARWAQRSVIASV
jgi:hypothetical protein